MVVTVCPSRETLLKYSLGMLPDEQRGALDSHLDGCSECQATIASLNDADDTLIGRLRTPLSSEAVLDEPQLHDALAAAMAMPVGDCRESRGPDEAAGESDVAAAKMGLSPSGHATERSDAPQVLGEYRLLEELGHGGMGRVYKALHTKLDRIVAVKVLPRGRVGDQQAIARFDREMKAVGRLDHPNIVQARDARVIDQTPVLIMEYIDGLDLAEIVRRLGEKRGQAPFVRSTRRAVPAKGAYPLLSSVVPIPDACELMRETALALQCAHEHGLVHRDVKPSNIMLASPLARSGRGAGGEGGPAVVKLLDLGLARLYGGELSQVSQPGDAGEGEKGGPEMSAGAASADVARPVSGRVEMTGAGQAMGTADYMAPEQASDSRSVDIRADLYSLGCTLYKLLSGRAPFSGPDFRTSLDKLNAHVRQPVPPVRGLVADVPERLAAILDRLLAKNPDDRFATPAEVAEALEPWCAGADLSALLQRAVEAKSSSLPGEGDAESRQASRPLPAPKRWKSLTLLALLVLLVGGLGFALGIVIRIHKDGRETTVEVPEGSNARVGPEGQVDVKLPGATSASLFSPASSTFLTQRTKEPPLQFGPVIEQVVNSLREGKGGGGLDLAGGKVVDVPKEFVKWPAEQQEKFSSENRVDLVAETFPSDPSDKTTRGLFGHGVVIKAEVIPQRLKLGAIPDELWDKVTRQDLQAAIASLAPESVRFGPALQPVAGISERGGVVHFELWSAPLTFAFQNRKGDLGILQVIRFTENPRGLRIRYKLAQQPAAVALPSGAAPAAPGALAPAAPGRPPAAAGPGGPAPGAPGVPSPFRASPEVTVVHPVIREVSDYEELTGRIEAAQTAEIRARVSGALTKVCFTAGATVKQGQLLFEIDCRQQEIELQKRRAEMGVAFLRSKRADAALERAKAANAQKAGSIAHADMERIATEREEAQAAVQVAKAGMELAEVNLGFTKPTAPISGIIGEPLLTPGNLVTAETRPLATIVAVDPMRVEFDVDEQTLLKLRRKASDAKGKAELDASLSVECGLANETGYPRRAKLESMDSQIVRHPTLAGARGVARWRATLPNPDGVLVPGLFARVRLITSAPHKALLIPERAITRGPIVGATGAWLSFGVPVVFVVNNENVAELRKVQLGQREGDLCVVQEGLSAEERVVTSKLEMLQPGMTVIPTSTATSPPAAAPGITWNPPAAAPSTSAPAPAATVPDEKAIQGTWEVVSSTWHLIRRFVELPPPRDEEVVRTTKVVIRADGIKIVGEHVFDVALECQFNSEANPKKLDLRIGSLIYQGIYELRGNQLRICLVGPTQGTDGKQVRPSEFFAEFGSKKELLVLRRVSEATITEDERTIQGTWEVESVSAMKSPSPKPAGSAPAKQSQAASRAAEPAFDRPSEVNVPTIEDTLRQTIRPHARATIYPSYVLLEENKSIQSLYYAIDPSIQPKRIGVSDMLGCPLGSGIYQLQGDRLTLCLVWGQAPRLRDPDGLVKLVPDPAYPRLIVHPPLEFVALSGPDMAMIVLKRVAVPDEERPMQQQNVFPQPKPPAPVPAPAKTGVPKGPATSPAKPLGKADGKPAK